MNLYYNFFFFFKGKITRQRRYELKKCWRRFLILFQIMKFQICNLGILNNENLLKEKLEENNKI